MGRVTELGERMWNGDLSVAKQHPWTSLQELEELATGVAFVSSFANVSAFDTSEGLVLIDAGSPMMAGIIHDAVRAWTKHPLHTVIYSHGHIDHVSGVKAFEEETGRRARVVAHEALPARFDRYRLTAGFNGTINARQFRVPGLAWPTDYRYPDVMYRSRLDLDVGGVRFELHHDRGETDDHTWTWLPERKILCTGDLFIWVTPNAGNPQKVQRYAIEWAHALRAMAALRPELLLPGHGFPIHGADRIQQALAETAEILESLHEQTLRLMNAGATLDDVLQGVRAPQHLLDRPYLRPVYDEPAFIVRNIWRRYGGWYDGNPANLKPASETALATEIAALAGGAARLAARASAIADSGELALACHLAEMAARAAPDDLGIRAARAAIYKRRAKAETSLMARSIYRAAADDGE